MRKLPSWTSLSLKEQIAQMIIVRTSGHLFDHQIRYPAWEANNSQLQYWLQELNVGGVILLGGSSVELQAKSQQLQNWASIPLFITADIEEGIGQRFPGGTWFPPPMALGEIYQTDSILAQSYARQMGQITAQEALAVGINWLFAPVVDVNNNPDNPVINIRAFGESPEVVSALSTAFIQGAKSSQILTTAKHFPGHGDTATDSHLDLPVLEHSESRLASVELPPFQSAIAAEVDSIMTAHLMIPTWDRDRPATLSAKIMTQQLRNKMQFAGLVVTDALIMGGVTKFASSEEVAIMAVKAGCDVLLMPGDPEITIASIYDEVNSGRIKVERIQQSLERIWQAKQRIRQLEIPPFNLFSPSAKSTVSSILRDSLQTRGNLPLVPNNELNARNLIVVDDVLNAAYLDINAPAVTIPQAYGYQRQVVDNNTLPNICSDLMPTLLQIFIRGNPFRGNSGLTSNTKQIYQQLIDQEKVMGIIIFGSPYVMKWFVSLIDSDIPLIYSYGQMPLAQEIALKTIFDFNSQSSDSNISADFGF